MISAKDIVRAWNGFFFEPESPLPIGLYRAALGLVILANQALLFPDVPAWFGTRGVLGFETARKISGGAGFSLFEWLPQTDFWVWLLYGSICVFAITLAIGLFTRLSAILLFLALVTLHHRNPLILNGGDTFLRIALFFTIFSQAGAAFSVDRLIRVARGREAGPPRPVAPWAMRLIQLQLAFLYFYAYLWKAQGAMWLDGTAIYYTSRLLEFWRFPVPYLFEHLWTIKLWSWATLLTELALGVLIWVKEFRYWVLLAGVLLHAGIDYSMNIPLFGPIMVSAYIPFLEPAVLERFFGWAREKWNALSRFTVKAPVFFDGKCSFCVRAVELVRRLDVLRRLEFVDMHEESTPRKFPDFDPARGQQEMLVRVNGQWLGGFYALRQVARHLPLLWIFLPLFYLPKVDRAGDRAYRRVAERRYCILNR